MDNDNVRDRLVSVVGGRARRYVTAKKPSLLIPFKGKFPLVEVYEEDRYNEEIESKMYIEDMSERFQRITILGNRMALMERYFLEYLEDICNLTEADFMKLKNSDKADKLVAWMDKDNLDFDSLTIEI